MEEHYSRNASTNDLSVILDLESKIWPEGTRAPIEKFQSRLSIFPEGFFLAFKDDSLIGVSTSQIIDYSPEKTPKSWEEITDNGFIKKTHNSQGNTLYVVSIGALSRSGGGTLLLSEQKKLAKKLNLQYLVLGARIPGYDLYCRESGELSIENYTNLIREDGLPLDPEIRFYSRNGLSVGKLIGNFMEDDRESRNYGALMLWENPDFRKS